VRSDEWTQLHEIVVESARAVFGAIGLAASYDGCTIDRNVQCAETISIIGLGGGLRGTLVLSVSPALLERSHPNHATDTADLADWLSELANLLLGRIKGRLLSHEVTIELSTPIVISASDFRFERFASPPFVHAFHVDGVPMHVVFEASDAHNAGLGPRRDSALGPGDMVTF
jgi:CheY-specific phosphatase CheX